MILVQMWFTINKTTLKKIQMNWENYNKVYIIFVDTINKV